MSVQDDAREKQLIGLFGLAKPADATRGGTDAELSLGEQLIRFEVKSTTDPRGSVTTVRDFGLDHVAKWKNEHWVFGFYETDGITLKYCHYASPKMMWPWISGKIEYVRPDLVLADLAPEMITMKEVHRILGSKDVYDLDDAVFIQKRQYKIAEYRAKMDCPDGYSPEQMLEILRDRCRYLILRGATLNNPHIPGTYFTGWEKITVNYEKRLRELVKESLQRKA